jgi:hypothetical protein
MIVRFYCSDLASSIVSSSVTTDSAPDFLLLVTLGFIWAIFSYFTYCYGRWTGSASWAAPFCLILSLLLGLLLGLLLLLAYSSVCFVSLPPLIAGLLLLLGLLFILLLGLLLPLRFFSWSAARSITRSAPSSAH